MCALRPSAFLPLRTTLICRRAAAGAQADRPSARPERCCSSVRAGACAGAASGGRRRCRCRSRRRRRAAASARGAAPAAASQRRSAVHAAAGGGAGGGAAAGGGGAGAPAAAPGQRASAADDGQRQGAPGGAGGCRQPLLCLSKVMRVCVRPGPTPGVDQARGMGRSAWQGLALRLQGQPGWGLPVGSAGVGGFGRAQGRCGCRLEGCVCVAQGAGPWTNPALDLSACVRMPPVPQGRKHWSELEWGGKSKLFHNYTVSAAGRDRLGGALGATGQPASWHAAVPVSGRLCL